MRLLPGPDGAKHEASLRALTCLCLGPGVSQAQILPVVDTSLVINLTRITKVSICLERDVWYINPF